MFEMKKLKYIVNILDEYRKPVAADKRNQNAEVLYPYYGASGKIDLIDGYTIDNHVMLIGEDGANLRMRNLPLMYEVNGKAWINNHAHILKPKEGYDFDFLFLALESLDINLYITGSAQPKLSQENLKEIMVPVTSYNKQKKISKYLKDRCIELDILTSDIQKQIDTLEQYKKSVITEAVTKGLNPDAEMKDSGIDFIGKMPLNFKIVRVKNIGSARNGLTYTPFDLCDEQEGILVLRSSNVQNGQIVFKDNVYVKCNVPPKLIVQQGDILICSRNGSKELIGKNAIIDENINASFGAFMMIYRCNVPKYMYYILNSEIFKYYLGSFFTSTINQLTNYNFGNMKIPYCFDEVIQKQITDYLDKKCSEIDTIISDKKKQLEVITEYKKSLIYEYVTGKKEVM